MSTIPRCFVAYASTLPAKGDAIESAIETLNNGGVVEVTSWRNLAINGRPIISAICEEIEKSQIVIADITNLNPNVLFELGYALSKRKRLWLTFNPNVSGAKIQFDRFQLLTTTGYASYSNSHDITNKFYSDEPYNSLEKTLFNDLTDANVGEVSADKLFYIKPDQSTEAVMRIARRVDGAPMPHITDDPKEIGVQSIEWYVRNVLASRGVVCQFLSDEYDDVQLSNAKAAFVAGMAYGLGKPLLMLAQVPYESPIDYRDTLRRHSDAKEAETFYQAWLVEILETEKVKTERKLSHRSATFAHGSLLALNIGDPIAEYESDELPEFFIPTSAYAEALMGQHSIFVGRKGTGKTATLLKVADELQGDPRNHICVIKPIDYELDGLLSLLQRQMTNSEKGFLVESFWKALTYTELAKSVYEKINERSIYSQKSDAEKKLIEFIDRNQELILPEVSTRLENLINSLTNQYESTESSNLKTRVSEAVHKSIIGTLRELLLDALDKVNKVAILVDNLDKNWTPRANIQLVSELLFGLLSVSIRVADEFKKSSLGKRRIDVSMTIFIRSDVYAAILSFAREPDKLPVRRIEWNDPELLVRVIERRVMIADQKLIDPKEVWSKYFVEFTRTLPTRDFLVMAVFPRPRDLIYLVRASLQNAVNRGHTRIEEKDIESGLDQYSGFVLGSLMSEGGPQFRQLDDFITQLFGGPTIVTQDDIREALEQANIAMISASFVVDLLQDLTFLSYETLPGKFVFCYEKDQKPKLSVLAEKTFKKVGARRYQIHPAFHSYLELSATQEDGQIPFLFGNSTSASEGRR